MVLHFANAESLGAHSYNSQIVDQCVDVSVNGDFQQRVYLRNTFEWSNQQTTVLDVCLKVGKNEIHFSASKSGTLHIDRIQIASPLWSQTGREYLV
jgi:hypothetical protein